jgi:DNA-directed RNA polymerase subunit RPC12/RpoP
MKCKYCGNKINFFEWVINGGKCIWCNEHFNNNEILNDIKCSIKYWEENKK